MLLLLRGARELKVLRARAGTTWMQAIVANLLRPPDTWSHVSEVTPFYDVARSWADTAPAPQLAASFVRPKPSPSDPCPAVASGRVRWLARALGRR